MKRPITETIVGLSCLVGFVIITALVVSGVSQNADLQAALLVNQYNLGSVGASLMVLVTSYGREVVWSLLVIVMFLAGNKQTKLLAMELAVLFIVGILVGDLAKLLVQRPRPDMASGILLRVPAEADPSYPSGHALIVSIGAAFALARFHRKTLAVLLALEAGIVCYSRVYVGVHYPLDVAGGVLLGIAIALIGTIVAEKLLRPVLEKLLEPINDGAQGRTIGYLTRGWYGSKIRYCGSVSGVPFFLTENAVLDSSWIRILGWELWHRILSQGLVSHGTAVQSCPSFCSRLSLSSGFLSGLSRII